LNWNENLQLLEYLLPKQNGNENWQLHKNPTPQNKVPEAKNVGAAGAVKSGTM